MANSWEGREGGKGGGGSSEGSGALAPKPNDAMRQAPMVGPHHWKQRPRRDSDPGGPNDTKNHYKSETID